MFVAESLEVHCAGRTCNRTCTATVAHRAVYLGYVACDGRSVRTTEILVYIRNGSVWTDVYALTATVTCVFIRLGRARIVLELVFYEQADCFCGGTG